MSNTKPEKCNLINQTAPMHELRTDQFIVWLRQMANYLDDGLEKHPSDFNEAKPLMDWINELHVLP